MQFKIDVPGRLYVLTTNVDLNFVLWYVFSFVCG